MTEGKSGLEQEWEDRGWSREWLLEWKYLGLITFSWACCIAYWSLLPTVVFRLLMEWHRIRIFSCNLLVVESVVELCVHPTKFNSMRMPDPGSYQSYPVNVCGLFQASRDLDLFLWNSLLLPVNYTMDRCSTCSYHLIAATRVSFLWCWNIP